MHLLNQNSVFKKQFLKAQFFETANTTVRLSEGFSGLLCYTVLVLLSVLVKYCQVKLKSVVLIIFCEPIILLMQLNIWKILLNFSFL